MKMKSKKISLNSILLSSFPDFFPFPSTPSIPPIPSIPSTPPFIPVNPPIAVKLPANNSHPRLHPLPTNNSQPSSTQKTTLKWSDWMRRVQITATCAQFTLNWACSIEVMALAGSLQAARPLLFLSRLLLSRLLPLLLLTAVARAFCAVSMALWRSFNSRKMNCLTEHLWMLPLWGHRVLQVRHSITKLCFINKYINV